MVTTVDRFTDQVVGAGWMHMKLNDGTIQSTSAVYYYNGAAAGLTFFGDPSGSTFVAQTDRGSFNCAHNCWNWVRTVASSSDTKCLTGFDHGYAEIWSISASSSNTCPASVEYAGLEYRPNSGGSWTNWCSGGGTLYCFDGSAFKT